MMEDTLLDSHSFVVGFIAGGFVISILALLFTNALNKFEDSKKSGKNVSVPVEGKESPRQIVQKSAQATGCYIISLILLAGGLVLMVIWLYRLWIL